MAIVRNEEFYLYHNEHNGCPSRLLDESGEVVWAARYDAWGKVKKLPVDEVDQPLRLQGQYFDGETGLHYNRFRYYCAEIGAFVSQDPLGLEADDNLYFYSPNIWGWCDPLGLLRSRAGRQNVLRKLADDPKQPKYIRGWAKNEIHRINQGKAKNIRLPYSSRTSLRAQKMGFDRIESGYDLAHPRGFEAAKGFNYKRTYLQEKGLHRLQHKYDLGGRLNKKGCS